MKHSLQTIAIVFISLLLESCGSSLSYQAALDKNRKNLDNMDQVEDAQFLVEAKSFNLLETRLNEMATQKGYSATLVNHAKRNLEVQEDLEREIGKLARKEKMKLPAEMKSEHAALISELDGISRADFDARFLDVMRKINEENEDIYEDKSSQANDADVRAFAARKLDMFKTLDDELSKVDDQLMQTHN